MRWCPSPLSTTAPFILSRGSGGTYRQRRRSMEQTWALNGMVGVSVGVGYHRLLIVGPWLAPKGGCEVGTCQNLTGKAVPRSVGGLQVHDSGPMDPRPLHRDHRCKPTLDQRLRGLGESLPCISDVTRPLGTPGGAMVGVDQHGMWAPGPPATSTCLLCPFSSLFCISFAIIPTYK